MNKVFALLVFGMISSLSAFAAPDDCSGYGKTKLSDGACMVTTTHSVYVTIDSKTYPVCSESSDTVIEKAFCDASAPYIYRNLRVLKWLESKKGVIISKDNTAKILACYNNLVIDTLSCGREPY